MIYSSHILLHIIQLFIVQRDRTRANNNGLIEKQRPLGYCTWCLEMPVHRVITITDKIPEGKILAALKDRDWSQGSIISCRATKSVYIKWESKICSKIYSTGTDQQQNLTITAAVVLASEILTLVVLSLLWCSSRTCKAAWRLAWGSDSSILIGPRQCASGGDKYMRKRDRYTCTEERAAE